MGQFLESEIKRLADDRYCKFDRQAPVDDVLPLLAGKGFEIRVLEGTFRGRDEFKRLYEGWIRHYFDERHKLRELHFTPVRDKAEVKVVVNRQARAWEPLAPTSKKLTRRPFKPGLYNVRQPRANR